jgi:hypothetical protein
MNVGLRSLEFDLTAGEPKRRPFKPLLSQTNKSNSESTKKTRSSEEENESAFLAWKSTKDSEDQARRASLAAESKTSHQIKEREDDQKKRDNVRLLSNRCFLSSYFGACFH